MGHWVRGRRRTLKDTPGMKRAPQDKANSGAQNLPRHIGKDAAEGYWTGGGRAEGPFTVGKSRQRQTATYQGTSGLPQA